MPSGNPWRNHYKKATEVFSFVAVLSDIWSVLQFLGIPVLALFGLQRAAGEIDPLTLSFPVRLLVLVILSGILGGLLGVTVTALARQRSQIVAVMGYFIAVVWGALMIVIVDSLSADRGDGQLLHFSMLMLVALGVFLSISSTALGSLIGSVDTQTSNERAAILFAVVATAVVAGGLSQLTDFA